MREALDKMVLEAFKLPPALLDPTEPNQNRDLFRFKSFPEFPKYDSLIHFSDGEIVPLPMYEKYATELKNVQFKPSRNALERLRGWSPRTDDWQPTDRGEHMSLNANTVQQMMQPVIQAAFTAEQEKAQVQAQLDTVNGQLRSTQSELHRAQERATNTQRELDYALSEKKSYRQQLEDTTHQLNQRIRESEEHHKTCIKETIQSYEDRERRLKQAHQDEVRALRRSYEEEKEHLRARILSYDEASTLLNVSKRGNKKAALAILTKSFFGDSWGARDLLKKVFSKGKKSTKNGKK